MTMHRSLAALLCATVLSSCDLFDKNAVRDITGPVPAARIKFHNFAPSSVALNFFANDVKMTGATSTTDVESTSGTTYSGIAAGNLYLGIAPGQYTLTGKMAAKDTIVSSVAQDIVAGKSYSFFASGVYNTTSKTADAFVVEDPIPGGVIDYTVAHVRFVNAVSNGTGDMTLFVKDTTTGVAEVAIGGPIAYKGASAFVAVPRGIYNVGARYTGVSTNVTGLSRTNLGFVGGRVYTITARGNTATASTMALDFSLNQR